MCYYVGMTTTEQVPLKATDLPAFLLRSAVQAAAEVDKAFTVADNDAGQRATGRQDAFTEALAAATGTTVSQAAAEVLGAL